MAKRVFELARELGVTSKVVLTKCRAEGLEIKNHMSTLSVGLEATIREWFSESGGGGTAVETAEQIDLETARKEASKRRRKKTPKPEESPPAEQVQPEQEALAEQAPADIEGPSVSEVPVAEAPEAAAVVEAPEEAPPEQKKPGKTARKPKKEPEEIKVAGPQVVPKPAALKGPRVVRIEKPEPVRRPRSRESQPPAALVTTDLGTGAATKRGKGARPGETEAEERGKKKGKRRSPRRRSGRTADSGEQLKEWRNQDLLERSERLAAAGGGLRRHRASVSHKMAGGPGVKSGPVDIEEPITVKSLSAATGIKVTDLIKKLLSLDIVATINRVIDRETTEALVLDYGIDLVIKEAKSPETELVEMLDSREKGEMAMRAPVATFLGHVDHGKTSLLDYIRNTTVTEGEAGGITQHIGAYRFDRDDTHVVFLDTPGHEAFTAMRARGANMTDVVVLVVAADDGVMPQTVEAISHAQAAEVPIVVALNKIDVPNANVQRALGQLAEHGLQSREWGGETEIIQTSAETGDGIDSLVETLSLEAELLELKAEADAPASGYVIEAEMDVGFGALARLLVLDGTLKVGDVLLAGRGYGRVRSIRDDRGRNIEEALPATPVEVAGLDELPEAGERFYVVPDDLERAREVAQQR
ncbi:MAG: translation initiation factor IF-2, partial [Planctomycetota bacterium]